MSWRSFARLLVGSQPESDYLPMLQQEKGGRTLPVESPLEMSVRQIDEWFKGRSDGKWEHNLGIDLKSTDNPGWWMTVPDLCIEKEALADAIGKLLNDYDAQVTTDGMSVRIFSPALSSCILATSAVINLEVARPKK